VHRKPTSRRKSRRSHPELKPIATTREPNNFESKRVV
jgi:hypothetical protein